MNRIDQLFSKKNNNILSIYFTAGHPNLNDTVPIIQALEKSGTDLIEIGIPFSDSLADGPTIQKCNEKALANGMSLKLLFEQLADIRDKIDIPLILMGSINPILQYGIEAFCKKAQEVGIDGCIIPDLPFKEFVDDYKQMFLDHNLYNIFLITPQTNEERVLLIDEHSNGFIYMVSSASTTGAKTEVADTQIEYYKRIEAMQLKNPRLIGFGISDNKTFARSCEYAHGGIIGSAFVKALEKSSDVKLEINNFVEMVLGK